MRKDIAIVPTYNREPLLWLCLEALRTLHSDLSITVFSDRGAISDDLRQTCDEFIAALHFRGPHDYFGNSYNVLEALRWASERPGVEIVHLVEDDTIVHRAWLTWACQQLRRGENSVKEFAAVCARVHGDPSTVWYESPCASWNVDFLKQALAEIPAGYYCGSRAEMQAACDRHFTNSRYRFGSAEQDGFFLRVFEKHKWRSAWPTVCLATHLGFYGYNRPPGAPQPEGETLADRVEYCRRLMRSRERRYELFGQRITDLEMMGENV